MSYEVDSIKRVGYFIESTFASDSSGETFTDLPIIEGTVNLTLTRDELDPSQLVQHIDEGRERVLGKRSASLSFQLNVAPTGVAAVNGVSSVLSSTITTLSTIFGGVKVGEGSVSAAGSTASVINVSTGDGSQWESGSPMGWVNAAGLLEVQEVESVSTDAVTLKHGFSAAPATSDVLYNGTTVYMTAQPTDTFAFKIEGLESDDKWLLTGCQAEGGVTMAIDVTGGAIPRVTVNVTAADWYDSTETSTDLTGALGIATFTNYNPIVGEAGRFEVHAVGTATYSAADLLPVSAVSFEPHVAFGRITSPSGKNAIGAWRKTRNTDSPVQGSFTFPYESTAWFAHRNSKSDLAVMYVAGVAAGSAFALSAPTVQVLNPQRVADAGGFAAQTVMWKGRRDTDAGASTTDLAKSPFRIHIL